MHTRSQRGPLLPLDLELERTLRARRRLLYISESESDTESTSTMADEERPPPPPPQRLFRDFGTPGSYNSPGPIVLPTTTTNFVMHPQFPNMVKAEAFGGKANECPYDHLDRFLEICSMVTTNLVDQEYIRLHLFRASLTGDAKNWFKSLPPQSLQTWDEVTDAFLHKYYPEWKTAEMRRKISHFEQESGEPLYEAWERFRSLVRGCPHHEFDTTLLIRFFYDGLDQFSRANLDAGSGGQLSRIPLDQIEVKIDEVVKNDSWGGHRRNQSAKGSGKFAVDTMDQLNAKFDMLAKLVKDGQQGKTETTPVMQFSCDLCGGTDHARSYCGGRDSEHVAAINSRDQNQLNRNNAWRSSGFGQSSFGGSSFGQGSHNTGYGNFGQGQGQSFTHPQPLPNTYQHPNAPNRGGFMNQPPPQRNYQHNPPQNKPAQEPSNNESSIIFQQFQLITQQLN